MIECRCKCKCKLNLFRKGKEYKHTFITDYTLAHAISTSNLDIFKDKLQKQPMSWLHSDRLLVYLI